MRVAGIGCSSDCPADELAALIRRAIAETGAVGLLATIAHRAALPSVQQVAGMLGLEIVPVDIPALAAEQHRCHTHSAAVARRIGLSSVAEAAALSAAGAGSRLVLPRITSDRATCAVAATR
jgi:cobalt-precorrin 5A hydrolase